MWDMHDGGWAWWVFMSLGMVVMWSLLIYGVVWLVRGGMPSARQAPPEAPLTVLKRRLASGDISAAEYEQLRATIDDEPGRAAGV